MPTSFEARHWLGFSSVMNLPDAALADDAPELPDDPELVWAKAGAARRAVVTRHAAMCFFSMSSSMKDYAAPGGVACRVNGEVLVLALSPPGIGGAVLCAARLCPERPVAACS